MTHHKILSIASLLFVTSALSGCSLHSNSHSVKSEATPTIDLTQYTTLRDNPSSTRTAPINLSEWELSWADEFDYEDAKLDENWLSKQGEFESDWVKGRRYRKNAVVTDGVLELRNIKDENDPNIWSSASVWTKEAFGYGYYEARYKYAAAYGTNNSFWFWPENGTPDGQKACEIDINEGHYPNIMNTNIHNWTDTWQHTSGRTTHYSDQQHFTLDGNPDHTVVLDEPVQTTKVRLRSDNPASIHISEFRVFVPSENYPEANADLGETAPENLAQSDDVTLTTNGTFNRLPSQEKNAIDGNIKSRWVSDKHGPKFLQIEWTDAKEVGAVQFINGWKKGNDPYRNLMGDFTLEYFDGNEWVEFHSYDAADVANYADEYHVYGFEWTEDYFKWFKDGELFHTMRNDVCFSDVNILLSMAILNGDIAGPVTDDVHGTSMKIDYVRYYQRKDQTTK